MDGLVGFLILGALFGIFVAIQKLNSNIITQIDQNERIIELLKEKCKNHSADGNDSSIRHDGSQLKLVAVFVEVTDSLTQ
ncbi:hypothetical protein [Paenibacillus sp. OAS669]|uniref:hypothetical protein n=1 Tax=Paenibacillus sp. OAS669 TaxID=2663821 RepID=UPI00178BA6B7|nr:hypothetical protein [Paenibacillus sp. OAS669]MBE1442644.1 hypothetical protein [Paenibacillus sp. OAS669]